jgi:uncharacterized protein YbaA (DUF1428 family)
MGDPYGSRRDQAQEDKAGEVWKELGALGSAECIGEEVPHREVTSSLRAVLAKDDEVAVFSQIVCPNKAERDAIVNKVTAGQRVEARCPSTASG